MITLFFLCLTALGLLALVVVGGWPERVIAVLVLVNILATPLLEPLQIGQWRAGLAALELTLFVAMWIVVEVRGRWWLTAAAGFQLIAVVSHLVSLTGAYFIWTAVSARIGVAGLLSLTFLFGAWEAWAARRFAREGATKWDASGPLKTQSPSG
ncbi:MAG: hypothetical protein EON91_02765 [Brevundimonas sp.]|uniref:hypothetical protein n=1 Tax=Brevundimonas sp. TaxID=1871086 RepID=UPI0012230282|nr:hypothetical protein [Brevundimonas sp.]RZJ19136.1 MAG: hypothetical protein EON91_02765 [Brevundimonas sp.]